MKKLTSVRVNNIRKVADSAGIKLEGDLDDVTFHFERDLLKNKDAAKFVKEYEKYFTTMDKNLLREFYEKTGLILMNEFESPEGAQLLTMYGFLRGDANAYGGYYNQTLNYHLSSNIKIDSPLELSDDMYYEHDYDKDEDWGFTPEGYTKLLENPDLIWDDEYEHCYKVGPHKNFVGAFGEHFEIKKGSLYRDGKKIEEKVKTVFRLNDYTSMIIFEDNRVESLEWCFNGWPEIDRYEKIVYGTFFIARLSKNGLLSVYIIDEDEPNLRYDMAFDYVEDFEFTIDPTYFKDTNGDLLIFPDKNNKDKYIKIPMLTDQPYVQDYCG